MQQIFFKKFLRVTAFLTASFFILNTLAWGQAALLPSGQQPQLSISAPTPNQPVLIHLQDAHANYTAQKDMAQILERLRREQGMRLVFVEGAVGQLDAKYLKFTLDPKLNEKIADKLARMGELTAADLFLLKNATGLEFVGIENPDLYRRDIEYLKKVFRAEKENRRWISENESAIDRRITWLGNKDLVAALRLFLHLEKNSQTLAKTIATLDVLSRRHLGRDLRDAKEQKEFPNLVRILKLKDEEGKIDQEKALAEQKKIEKFSGKLDFKTGNPRFELERVYSELGPKKIDFKKYPEFCRYARHLIFSYELRSSELFEEINRWMELLLIRLAEKAEEKQAVHEVREAKLVAKLLLAELSRKEWEEAEGLTLLSKTVDAQKFYELAVARETAFVATIQKTLKAKNQSRAVIITGGFHTDALRKYFSDHRSQYQILSPRVDGDSHENYVNTMLGRKPSDIATSDAAVVPWALDEARAASLGVDPAKRNVVREKVIAQVTGKSLGNWYVPPGKININTADEKTIAEVLELKPFTIRLILERRAKKPFLLMEELRNIRGIGDATFERLRHKIVLKSEDERSPARPGRLRIVLAPHGTKDDMALWESQVKEYIKSVRHPLFFAEMAAADQDAVSYFAPPGEIYTLADVFANPRVQPMMQQFYQTVMSRVNQIAAASNTKPFRQTNSQQKKSASQEDVVRAAFYKLLNETDVPVVYEQINYDSWIAALKLFEYPKLAMEAFAGEDLAGADKLMAECERANRNNVFASNALRDHELADQIEKHVRAGWDVVSVLGAHHTGVIRILKERGVTVEPDVHYDFNTMSPMNELSFGIANGGPVDSEIYKQKLRREIVNNFLITHIFNQAQATQQREQRLKPVVQIWSDSDIEILSKKFKNKIAGENINKIFILALLEILIGRMPVFEGKTGEILQKFSDQSLNDFAAYLAALPAGLTSNQILESVKDWIFEKFPEYKPEQYADRRGQIYLFNPYHGFGPGTRGSSLGNEKEEKSVLENYYVRLLELSIPKEAWDEHGQIFPTNELELSTAIPLIQKLTQATRRQFPDAKFANVGVSLDQNFGFLAVTGVDRVFFLDIDSINALILLPYLGLVFGRSETRAEFLANLYGKELVPLWKPSLRGASFDDLWAKIQDMEFISLKEHRRFQQELAGQIALWVDRPEMKTLKISKNKIEVFLKHYFLWGRVEATRGGWLDAFARGTWLGSEEAYQRVRSRWMEGKIIGVIGNVWGSAMRNIMVDLDKNGERLLFWYLSNVPTPRISSDQWKRVFEENALSRQQALAQVISIPTTGLFHAANKPHVRPLAEFINSLALRQEIKGKSLGETAKPRIEFLSTVGYSKISIQEFIQYLKENRINVLVDVREFAYSSKDGFKSDELKRELMKQNPPIQYIFPRGLGAPKEFRSQLNADGRLDKFRESYLQYLEKRRRVLEELLPQLAGKRACLMSVEDDPSESHRSILREEILKLAEVTETSVDLHFRALPVWQPKPKKFQTKEHPGQMGLFDNPPSEGKSLGKEKEASEETYAFTGWIKVPDKTLRFDKQLVEVDPQYKTTESQRLVAQTPDGNLAVTNPRNQELIARFSLPAKAKFLAAALNADGNILAIVFRAKQKGPALVRIVDVEARKLLQEFPIEEGCENMKLALNREGSQLAIEAPKAGSVPLIHLYEISTGLLWRWMLVEKEIASLRFSSDGQYLFTRHGEGSSRTFSAFDLADMSDFGNFESESRNRAINGSITALLFGDKAAQKATNAPWQKFKKFWTPSDTLDEWYGWMPEAIFKSILFGPFLLPAVLVVGVFNLSKKIQLKRKIQRIVSPKNISKILEAKNRWLAAARRTGLRIPPSFTEDGQIARTAVHLFMSGENITNAQRIQEFLTLFKTIGDLEMQIYALNEVFAAVFRLGKESERKILGGLLAKILNDPDTDDGIRAIAAKRYNEIHPQIAEELPVEEPLRKDRTRKAEGSSLGEPYEGYAMSRIAERAIVEKRFEDAIEILQHELYRFPRDVIFWTQLARARCAVFDWPRALRAINEAQKINSLDERIFFDKAKILFEIGGEQELKEALEVIDTAIQLQPQAVQNFVVKIQILRKQKLRDDAYKLLKETMEKWPKDPKLFGLEANLLADRGDLNGAIEAITRGLQANPDDLKGHIIRGDLLEKRAQREKDPKLKKLYYQEVAASRKKRRELFDDRQGGKASSLGEEDLAAIKLKSAIKEMLDYWNQHQKFIESIYPAQPIASRRIKRTIRNRSNIRNIRRVNSMRLPARFIRYFSVYLQVRQVLEEALSLLDAGMLDVRDFLGFTASVMMKFPDQPPQLTDKREIILFIGERLCLIASIIESVSSESLGRENEKKKNKFPETGWRIRDWDENGNPRILCKFAQGWRKAWIRFGDFPKTNIVRMVAAGKGRFTEFFVAVDGRKIGLITTSGDIHWVEKSTSGNSLGEKWLAGLDRFMVPLEELAGLKTDLWMWTSSLSKRLLMEQPANILAIREATQRIFDLLIPFTELPIPAEIAGQLAILLQGAMKKELARADEIVAEAPKKIETPEPPVKTVSEKPSAVFVPPARRYVAWLEDQKNIIVPIEHIYDWVRRLPEKEAPIDAVIIDGQLLWIRWQDTRVRKIFDLRRIDYLEINPDWSYLAAVYQRVSGKFVREYFYHSPVSEYRLPMGNFRAKLGDFEIFVDKDPTINNGLPIVSLRYPGFQGVVTVLDPLFMTYASLLKHPEHPELPAVPNYLILYKMNGTENFGFAVQEVERKFFIKTFPSAQGLSQKISFQLGNFLLRPQGYLFDATSVDAQRFPFKLQVVRLNDGVIIREFNQKEFMEIKRIYLKLDRHGEPDPRSLFMEKENNNGSDFLLAVSGRSLGSVQAVALDVTDHVIAREDEQVPGFLNRMLGLGVARAETVSAKRNLRPILRPSTATLPIAMIVTESIAKAPHAAEDISDALAQYPGSRIVLVWNPDETTQFVKRPEYFDKLVKLAEKSAVQVKDLMTHQPGAGELKILLRGYASGVSLQVVRDMHNIPEFKSGFARFKLDEEAFRASGLNPKQVFERLIHLSETGGLAQLQLDGKLKKDHDGFWLASHEFFQYLLANYASEKLTQKAA
ncbi:MAG: DUF488 family protein [Candidatus Omnitrophica bacterium]|nr:DUF488 family protein [Candidatus Omnitrophota bacterium]